MSIDFSLSAILPVMRMCNPLQALLLAVSSTLRSWTPGAITWGKAPKVYVEGRLENTEHTTLTSDRFTVSALCAVRYSRNPSPIVPQQCHAIEASARPSRNPSPIPLVIASREYRLPRAGRPAVRRFRSSFKRADDQKNQQANTEENRRSMKRPYRSSWIRPEVFIHSEREHV